MCHGGYRARAAIPQDVERTGLGYRRSKPPMSGVFQRGLGHGSVTRNLWIVLGCVGPLTFAGGNLLELIDARDCYSTCWGPPWSDTWMSDA